MALFAGVGVLNTLVDLAVFAALVTLLAVPPLMANVVSYGAGALNSYLMNGRVTFRARGVRLASWRRAARFAAVNLGCLLVSLAALAALSSFMPVLAAKLGSVIATFTCGYVLNSLLVYGSRPQG